MFHNELVNLLRTLGLDATRPPSEEAWQQLLGDLSRSYTEAERVRFLMKRSFAFSSREMRQLNASLAAERDEFAQIFRAAPVGMARVELDGHVSVVNTAMATIVGMQPEELCGRRMVSFVHAQEEIAIGQMLTELTSGRKGVLSGDCRLVHRSGTIVFTKFGAATVHDERGVPQYLIAVLEDVSERNRLEIELRHAQKLESVGRLAAGIAHEINAPMQLVGDNVGFLDAAFSDLLQLCQVYRNTCEKATATPLDPTDLARLRDAEKAIDLTYLQQAVPRSISATLDGARKVAQIVEAMKGFAHPEGSEKTQVDLNAALRSTVTVATSELENVAEVEIELQPLPPVPCFLSDLNQVFLNLLVNAAHAVGDVMASTSRRGRIRVKSQMSDNQVLISISDTGTGIPEPIRDRIFDPFFTTKALGKGTGQGLALARSVVVERHGGSLSFETEVGKGTTFFVRLPLHGAVRYQQSAVRSG